MLFSVLGLLIPLDAYSASDTELKTAYNKGTISAFDYHALCGDAAKTDKKLKKEPDPSAASYKIVESAINPYGASSRDLQDEWTNGFVSSCSDKYMDTFTGLLFTFGVDDAKTAMDRELCYDVGKEDAENGLRAEPQKNSNSFAMSHLREFDFSYTPQEESEYISGYSLECNKNYNRGYEDGKEDSKRQEDLDLAREVGDTLGINEDDVVDFLGGEEKIQQVYEDECVIATASFGSPMANEVQMLREIRDNQLLQTESGSAFMNSFNMFYYSFAPTVAGWEHENPAFKEVVKIAITPLITSLSLLNYVSMDSEGEVLTYGISMILLNLGMYIAAPIAVVWQVRKRI